MRKRDELKFTTAIEFTDQEISQYLNFLPSLTVVGTGQQLEVLRSLIKKFKPYACTNVNYSQA